MVVLEILHPEPPPLRTDEGGVVRIGETRVSLDTLIYAFNNGSAAEEIVYQYPTLRLKDVYSVIAYYLWNREEVEAYLAARQQEAEELQKKMEMLFPPQGIRERLLARLSVKT